MLTKHNRPLHVLITRPEPKGRVLAQHLQTLGIASTCQSFFNYQATSLPHPIAKAVPDIIIFVSIAAVHYAQSNVEIHQWLQPESPHIICAVGQATQQALSSITKKTIHCPEIQTSEGLLTLSVLQKVENKCISIVRGNGGREYLATILSDRRAKVQYVETYTRNWHKIDNKIIKQWQATKINCIVITSNDLLDKVSTLINSNTGMNTDKINSYWFNECTWLVASDRIERSARALGITKIINCHGASDNAISQTLIHLNKQHSRKSI